MNEIDQGQINFFELRLADDILAEKYSSDTPIWLDAEIYVDEIRIDEIHDIDLPTLLHSLVIDGCYEIFTCGCAVWGCAGIPEAVQVTHLGTKMNWRMCKPLSFQDMMESEIINYGYDPYQHIEFTFNRDQVITAIQRFIDEVRNLLGNEPQRFGWPVQGFDVEKLLSIDLLNP